MQALKDRVRREQRGDVFRLVGVDRCLPPGQDRVQYVRRGHHVDQEFHHHLLSSLGGPYPAGYGSEVVREAVPQHQCGHRGDRDDRGAGQQRRLVAVVQHRRDQYRSGDLADAVSGGQDGHGPRRT